ncbi:hypothetical protein LXM25_00235 [Dyadobacter sp. LJ53]|uniref:hypothetical protein n=1 Tax=Dyadobacter chenwenxiniae TaxID=2906456 RepID=UPI001F3D376A|nr:hypothetical protein [Dyadobacter chenwenxiniae]MCF0048458.1 hypothetical protein [Dyadobacter chenwenxiniae]
MKNWIKKAMVTLISLVSIHAEAQQTILYRGDWHPESVISDGQFLFVTDIGKELDPLSKDGDGSISKFSLDGTLIKRNISLITLHAPKGMGILGRTVFVADLDRLVGIDLITGKPVVSIDFSGFGVQLLNDITVKNDSTLFVSATDKNVIYEVCPRKPDQIHVLNVAEIKGVNGLFYDPAKNRLYVAGFGTFTSATGIGQVGYIDWTESGLKFTGLTGIAGFFDGIALVDADHVVVSDWVDLANQRGVLKKINLKTRNVTLLNTKSIAGPADFMFDKNKSELIVPAALNGELLKQTL